MEKGAVLMERSSSLVELLARGKEQTRRLEANFSELSSSSQQQRCNIALVQEIHSIFTEAIAMTKLNGEMTEDKTAVVGTATYSPHSFTDSPRSETSELGFKDLESREMCKKRRTLPRWTKQVEVAAGAGTEALADDGYNWRKYGQKEILGATYPRGYYRCTHRNAQGCLAMKQVQRSDSNPSIFEVTYRGEHTCSQKLKQNSSRSHNQSKQKQQEEDQQQQLLLSFKAGLKVKTEGLNSGFSSATSFSFPSTPLSCPPVTEQHFLSSRLQTLDNHLMPSFSSAFISPAASETNRFPLSPCGTTNYGIMNNSDSEVISALTSATVGSSWAFDELMFDLDPDSQWDKFHFA